MKMAKSTVKVIKKNWYILIFKKEKKIRMDWKVEKTESIQNG